MCVFRRNSAGAQDGTAQDSKGAQALGAPDTKTADRPTAESAKGRPTPKRSEAERGRRYEAMKRGEDWALQPRDRGPVKALARDYVDAHRRLSEYYMYVMVALIVLLFIRTKSIQAIAEPIALVLILFMIIDAIILRLRLKRLVAERLPGQSARGATMYAVMRALQIRKMRVPAPRVRPGDTF